MASCGFPTQTLAVVQIGELAGSGRYHECYAAEPMINRTSDDEQRICDALARLGGRAQTEVGRWRTALTLAFYAGELERAERILEDATARLGAVCVLDDVLAPAMHDIGALWERNEITVADEQLATSLAHRLLAAVAVGLQLATAKSTATILLANPAPERHTMGLLMAGDVLRAAGYHTVVLVAGAGLPDDALRSALLVHRPAIVGLSATMPVSADFVATASMVHELLPEAALITGGAAGVSMPAGVVAEHITRLDGLVATVDAILDQRDGLAPNVT